MHILSIETSCDETAAAIVEWSSDHSTSLSLSKTIGTATVTVSTVSSQASLHAKWGGVVPNLAAREHVRNIVPVIEETLERGHLTPQDIDLIAVTEGPGLMPALMVGVTAAKTLATVWDKPLIGIHHLEGHIYANFVDNNQSPKSNNQKETFPLIALVVSGGHTQLVLMKDHFQYEILGETQDDAAGEAFDKVAKMLGLPYPGGPVVAKRADAFRLSSSPARREVSSPRDGGVGDSRFQIPDSRFEFPRPMLDADNYDFSFSGLKTSVLYFLKKHEAEMKHESFIDMVCHEFQEAVVDVLVGKSERAIQEYRPKTFTIAGGVSANVRLRERLETMIAERFPDTTFTMPEFQYSLDNAAMIGVAAAYRYALMDEKARSALMNTHLSLDPNANLPLK